MRLLTFSLAAGFALGAIASTAAAQGSYAGGQLGFGAGGGEFDNTGFDLELDTGVFVNGFVGKDFGNVRVEGEIAYRQNDMDNLGGIPVIGEMSSTAFMGNAYYDFGSGAGATPYLGIGAGVASVKFESGINDTQTTLAMQLMVGVSFPVSQTLSITGELRGFGAYPEFSDGLGGTAEQEYVIGTLALGVRASF